MLYIEQDCNTHYCLIKDISSLLNKSNHQTHLCRNCLQLFSSEIALKNHQDKCLNHASCKVIMPDNKSNKLKFTKHHLKIKLPIIIYADFEAINKRISTASNIDTSSYTKKIVKQEIISYGLYVKSDYPNLISSQYFSYTGYDCKEKFAKDIIDIYKLSHYNNAHKTEKLSHKQQEEFDNATKCYICNVCFSEEVKKIREHNHFNGKYRGAACQSCNTIEGKASKIIPVFFHNGSK